MSTNRVMPESNRSSSGEAELPGYSATHEQISMLETRYRLAASIAPTSPAAIVEIGAGAGQGLACLEDAYEQVVLGDLSTENVSRLAQLEQRDSTSVERFSAEEIPLQSSTYDTVLMLEVINYFANPAKAIAESMRLLKSGGKLLITAPNPECVSFVPSAESVNYYSCQQLRTLLTDEATDVEIFVAYLNTNSLDNPKILKVRRIVSRLLEIIPGTRFIRSALRRSLLGYSQLFPISIQPGTVDTEMFNTINAGNTDTVHKVIYAIATK